MQAGAKDFCGAVDVGQEIFHLLYALAEFFQKLRNRAASTGGARGQDVKLSTFEMQLKLHGVLVGRHVCQPWRTVGQANLLEIFRTHSDADHNSAQPGFECQFREIEHLLCQERSEFGVAVEPGVNRQIAGVPARTVELESRIAPNVGVGTRLFREDKKDDDFTDVLKTRIDNLDLSTRTLNALTAANIRTLGGLARKKREDLLEVEGIGEKGIMEIKKVLGKFGFNLKE